MAELIPKSRTAILILLGFAALYSVGRAQTNSESAQPAQTQSQPVDSNPFPPDRSVPAAASPGKPLPNIVAMMHDVETNQRKAESIEKDYIYHSVETEQEVDSHGQVKKTTVTESDHYWVDGVPVRRVVKKNGKPLSPEEIAKEDDRIKEIAAKAREKREKADNEGKETDPRGDDEITVSRFLTLGAFTNARRVLLNGRDTIAVDFAGDPKAKTKNRAEDAIRDMVGTIWIDEQDHRLARVEGHFVNAFKIAGGLVANIQKDTRFSMQQTKINDEAWLPSSIDARGTARFLLFFNFNGSVHAVQSDYRKFRATSTILPGVTRVDSTADTANPSPP
jgi:hypothetical protein